MMQKIDVGQLAQLLGNIGVIVGVVFLALEINQNSTLLEAEARTARAQVRIDAYDQAASNSWFVLESKISGAMRSPSSMNRFCDRRHWQC